MRHVLKIGDTEHAVTLTPAGGGYRLRVGDGPERLVQVKPAEGGRCRLMIDGKMELISVATEGDRAFVHAGGQSVEVAYVDPVRRLASGSGSAANDAALAPMPGTVVAVHVKAGDQVESGQTLIVIESMKLETTIKAWRNGVVAQVPFAKGDQFERSVPLIVLVADTAEGT